MKYINGNIKNISNLNANILIDKTISKWNDFNIFDEEMRKMVS